MVTVLNSFKRLVIGEPISSDLEHEQRLTKKIALAVFSSDAVSSVAYATEEIVKALFPLILVATFGYVTEISLAIVAVLILVAISYRQTVYAYPQGGGSYIVARDNLGETAGLTAAAALLIDYVLTVAVSVSSGVEAIVSAFPSLLAVKAWLGVIAITIVCVGNLRGIKESGRMFALPTYLFIASLGLLIIRGVASIWFGNLPPAGPFTQAGVAAPSLALLLMAFSSGCSALTGIEAISDGVQAFHEPVSRNAATTLALMAGILSFLFAGTSYLATHLPQLVGNPVELNQLMHSVVVEQHQSLISAIASVVVGKSSWFYYLLQISTMAILLLAANTAFADFPRLSSILARDGYLPRQLANRGDRLVFSNGIIILALMAMALLWIAHGSTHALIPLYAVGVFLSFTLSQAGMVRRWLRSDDPRRGFLAAVNLMGCICTAVVLCVVCGTKFLHGAWVVVLSLPILVTGFRHVRKHYDDVQRQLTIQGAELGPIETRPHFVLVPLANLHRGVLHALQYARSLTRSVQAVTVEAGVGTRSTVTQVWEKVCPDVPLVTLPSPHRSIVGPLVDYVKKVKAENPGCHVTIVIPEFVVARWWQHLLHNQSALILRTSLAFERNVVVTSVRFHLDE